MTEFVIEAVGLRKAFKGREALSGLNLTVPQGSISGFLGRNGAGKTTTIRILMGLARADHGSARIFGIAPGGGNSGAAIRRRIGFVTEEKELYPYMTVAEIIRFSRPFFPKWRDDLERRYLNVFDLQPNKKISFLTNPLMASTPSHWKKSCAHWSRCRRQMARPSFSPPINWRRWSKSPIKSPSLTKVALLSLAR